ncbi:glycosyltransferase family 9 protein [Megasphaera sp. An286]|uniref:glycosyltransferase family 9 protein n=1 Tax=Megasphaera sp. An286 TaxID=1965622 RepID=UPI00117F4051|nr:glycosyltransferase family 9 protein [Megasphaera sp. An286]
MINNTQRIKILVELMHGIGDTVCAIPMLKILRGNYPDAEIVVLTKSAVENK